MKKFIFLQKIDILCNYLAMILMFYLNFTAIIIYFLCKKWYAKIEVILNFLFEGNCTVILILIVNRIV